MRNLEERSRNTTSLGPGHLLSALVLYNHLKGWAELAWVEALPVGALALGYSCQTPPSCGLIPLLNQTLDSFRHLPGVLPSYPHPLPARFIQFLISGVFVLFCFFFLSLNSAACEQPDCLLKIEYHTLNPIPGCPSFPEKAFALKTKEALINHCPGYSETEVSPKHQMPAFAMSECGERSPE